LVVKDVKRARAGIDAHQSRTAKVHRQQEDPTV
jgi:hypothetical protein